MAFRVTQPKLNIKEKLRDLDYEYIPYDKMPPGSIIQVENTTYVGTATIAIPGDDYIAISQLDVDIKPRCKNSKFLISAAIFGECGTPDQNLSFRLGRVIGGNTHSIDHRTLGGAAAGSRNATLTVMNTSYHGDDNTSTPTVTTISNFLDDPRTDSPITYRVFIGTTTTAGDNWDMNRPNGDSNSFSYEWGVSWLTIQEVRQ
jgi:hypothetical protein